MASCEACGDPVDAAALATCAECGRKCCPFCIHEVDADPPPGNTALECVDCLTSDD